MDTMRNLLRCQLAWLGVLMNFAVESAEGATPLENGSANTPLGPSLLADTTLAPITIAGTPGFSLRFKRGTAPLPKSPKGTRSIGHCRVEALEEVAVSDTPKPLWIATIYCFSRSLRDNAGAKHFVTHVVLKPSASQAATVVASGLCETQAWYECTQESRLHGWNGNLVCRRDQDGDCDSSRSLEVMRLDSVKGTISTVRRLEWGYACDMDAIQPRRQVLSGALGFPRSVTQPDTMADRTAPESATKRPDLIVGDPQAKERANQRSAFDKDDTAILENRTHPKRIACIERAQQVTIAYDRAGMALIRGDYHAAKNHLDEVRRVDPDHELLSVAEDILRRSNPGSHCRMCPSDPACKPHVPTARRAKRQR